jgi:CRISPR-associated protein Cas2
MRRLYLVAYDIRDSKRLRQVHKIMKGYGDGVQYSVFLCTLSRSELIELKWDLGDVINEAADQVLIVDLGLEDGSSTDRFDFLGFPPKLPSGGAVVV